MRWAVAAAVTLVVSPSVYAQQNPVLPGVRMIELDDRAVRVQAIGLQDRRPGAPVIVFEAGASNALELWGGILPQVAAMAPGAPVVAYDHAGLGCSEWDGTTPTPRRVADRLRRVLQQIAAKYLAVPLTVPFDLQRNEDYDIYTIRPDGTGLRQLTTTSGNDAHSSWSPDGEYLMFSSSRFGFKDEAPLFDGQPQPYGEIFIMRADGSGQRPLTDNQWEDGPGTWQPVAPPHTAALDRK